MPTHNRPEFLVEALQSIRDQVPAPPDEVVVVDDSANECTAALVAEATLRYPEMNILYVPAPSEQSGASRSRNIGFAHTHGDIVFFLDDDDLWTPQQVRLLCEALDSNSDFAVAGLRKSESTGEVLKRICHPTRSA